MPGSAKLDQIGSNEWQAADAVNDRLALRQSLDVKTSQAGTHFPGQRRLARHRCVEAFEDQYTLDTIQHPGEIGARERPQGMDADHADALLVIPAQVVGSESRRFDGCALCQEYRFRAVGSVGRNRFVASAGPAGELREPPSAP